MGFIQQFHLVIKYKKGTSNKVVDMLCRPPIVASIILKNTSLSHDSYVEKYAIDEDFKEVYENDAGASPTHQASQRRSGGQLDKPAQILKTLWNCCANLK
jgi:hypothetical protein